MSEQSNGVNSERLRAIVEAYGADPRRWPAHERLAARALAERDGVDLSAARELDRLLNLTAETAAPSELLRARILRAAPMRESLRAPLAALAACMVVGVLIGVGAGLNAPAAGGDDVLAEAFDSPGDWSEL
ncbi:MAG: hypothetical protein AB7O98_05280 [Hyphomonadaceae bacterium]